MATYLYIHIHSYPGHARVYKVSTWIILIQHPKVKEKNHLLRLPVSVQLVHVFTENIYFTPSHTQVYTAKAEQSRRLSEESMKSFLLYFSFLLPLNFRNVWENQNDGSSVAVETKSVLLHAVKQTIRQGPRWRAWGLTTTQPKCGGQLGNTAV